MLGGQNLGGSHQTGLATIVQRHQHTHHSHQGFTAAYISLQQPVHLFPTAAILTDFFNHPFLCIGQFER